MNNITIQLDGTNYNIPGAGYTYNLTFALNDTATQCYLGIIPSTEKYVTLGGLFLGNYYTSFDYSSLSVSFGVNSRNDFGQGIGAEPADNPVNPPTPPTPTPTPTSSKMAWWAVMLIILAVVVAIIGIGFLIKSCSNSKKQEEEKAMSRNLLY